MVRYLCTNCGYRFRPRGNEEPKECPYCGQKGTLVREDNVLKDIMDEVENKTE